ncbi:beta-mannosidase-like isoform X1 [Thrips palmi]|uniref:beta-mannosidase n=1 Tax=Thrips palmi TaxID=161013 RepID=A0A6P9A0V9_THRPL|nr:beta-mannosidase-like isoform X1 [Thrips palmi]XP_034250950.1 beta-mannosidase-like isoform X1 [Thrips palmi]
MTWLHRLVVVVLLLGTAAARHRPRPHQVPLDGGDWTLYSEVGGVQVAGSVPGGVYSDLRAAGQLPKDLFYRFNDEDYRWVAKANWTYDRSFQVPRGVLAKDKQVLVLHGVDTVAEVRLNGRVLGTTDNMFVRYRFDVKGILKDAHNRLQVRFTSPTAEASRRAAEQDKQYPVPPACPDASYHGECGVNHLRKMQASFSWDWGPAFPSMGLWKSVHIEAYTTAVLRNVGFTARPAAAATAKRWDVAVRAYWEVGARPGESPPRALLSVTLTGPDGKVAASEDVAATLSGDAEGAGFTDVALFLPKDKVQMWWPSGYGAQPLYTVHVALRAFTNWGQSDRGDLWDQMTVKSGFRTVELVQEPVDEAHLAKGLTYYFRVNGVAVFAKGSNWIPAHVLPELGGDPGVVGHLLHSAKEANMNMLRVWGGGVYESDLFYELADELGIMVWQDLMFACAMYPVGSAFLRSVDTEVRQQYRRLNRHPSVVVWAGNNENEAALRGDWYHTQGPLFEQYHRDYVKLYVDTARAAVRAEGLATPFAVSSPSNGAQSEADGFLAENPYSSLYGDDHHYDYLSDAWNPAVFHNTRFGSEYGFMSWPKRPTMMDATDSEHADEDLALGSTLAASRQHHPGGNLEIAMQIMQHLPLPQDFNKSEHFDTVAYYSQIYQAMATKTETEFLRRSRNLLTPLGEGRTMGALYWQLNDVWQAPSWAGIDFSGRWKMLHHYAVDFLAPLLVSPFVNAGTLLVDVVSDAPRSGELLVHTDVLAWDSFQPRAQSVNAVTMKGAGSTVRALVKPMWAVLREAGCPENATWGQAWGCVILFRLTDTNNATLAENFLLPFSPKETRMPTATFQLGRVGGPFPGTQHQRWDYELTLVASSPAAFVWLEAGPVLGRFSRNGFHVTGAEGLELRFHSDQEMPADELLQHLTVRALNGQGFSRVQEGVELLKI